MLFRARTRIRRPRPRAMSSLTRIPASRVFPSPTASAIRIRWRGWRSAWRAGSSWYGTRSIAARWPMRMRSSLGTACRSRLSRRRMLSANPGDASRTSRVSAGSSTSMRGSRAVRKMASRSRTSSETPSQRSCLPPSAEGSTRRITHSASRMTTRTPGANVVGGAAAPRGCRIGGESVGTGAGGADAGPASGSGPVSGPRRSGLRRGARFALRDGGSGGAERAPLPVGPLDRSAAGAHRPVARAGPPGG